MTKNSKPQRIIDLPDLRALLHRQATLKQDLAEAEALVARLAASAFDPQKAARLLLEGQQPTFTVCTKTEAELAEARNRLAAIKLALAGIEERRPEVEKNARRQFCTAYLADHKAELGNLLQALQAAVDAVDRYEDFMKFLHSNVGHDLQPIHLLCPDQQFVPKLRYQAKTFRELTANYLA